jgi:hypothetical protein
MVGCNRRDIKGGYRMEEGGRDDIHVRMHNFWVMHNIITGLPSKYAKIIIK